MSMDSTWNDSNIFTSDHPPSPFPGIYKQIIDIIITLEGRYDLDDNACH